MSTKSALLGLVAETSIHAGAGSMTGVIDLPIQREAHTEWPCIFGSGVKGALRAKAETGGTPDWLAEVFGPDTNHASDHAGAIAVTDARLLLLPVRSLSTHFKWVTCPAILDRFRADAERLGVAEALGLPTAMEAFDKDVKRLNLNNAGDPVALVASGDDQLFLEEWRFTASKANLDALIDALAAVLPSHDAKQALRDQLAVVSNDLFRHLARYATPVNAHVRIDNQTKTVEGGALWYEESLPPDTVMYTGIVAFPSRKDKSEHGAAAILQHVTGDLFKDDPYLQLGGNETVGMGWFKVRTQEA